MRIRVGLVGLGSYWETRHRPALRALSDRFDVRAVCEQVAHRADQAAREFNARQVDGFRALADREDVDAVLLLSRQWYGALPILAACDSGKAVYCAASLEMGTEEARRIKERVDEAGIAFMSEFPRRYTPATLRLKELIATRLGKPRLLFCHLRVPFKDSVPGRGEPPPKSDRQELIELIDWCSYVVGHPPTSVLGLSHEAAEGDGCYDYQMMNLDFSPLQRTGSGPTAQISCGRYMPDTWPEAVTFRPPAALQVSCENGIAFVDLPASVTWFDKAGRHLESLESERPVGEQLLSQFYRSVTSLVRNTAGLEDSYRGLWIATQARISHREGRRIPLT